MSPNRISASAVPPSWPGYQACDQRRHAVEPALHVVVAAPGRDHDRVLVRGHHRLDQLVLRRREAEGAVRALGLGRGIEARGHDHDVDLGRQRLGERVDPVALPRDAQLHARRRPLRPAVVLEHDLVRPGVERHRHVVEQRLVLRPVVDHDLVVDGEPEEPAQVAARADEEVVGAGRLRACSSRSSATTARPRGGRASQARADLDTRLDVRDRGRALEVRVLEVLGAHAGLAAARGGPELRGRRPSRRGWGCRGRSTPGLRPAA